MEGQHNVAMQATPDRESEEEGVSSTSTPVQGTCLRDPGESSGLEGGPSPLDKSGLVGSGVSGRPTDAIEEIEVTVVTVEGVESSPEDASDPPSDPNSDLH